MPSYICTYCTYTRTFIHTYTSVFAYTQSQAHCLNVHEIVNNDK